MTYVIFKYLNNYILFIRDEEYFSIDYLEDLNFRNRHITIDLSPFFLYNDQINSLSDDLKIKFKNELEDLTYNFHKWIHSLIINLKAIGNNSPPSDLNSFLKNVSPPNSQKKFYKKFMDYFILIGLIVLPHSFSLICDFFTFL